MDSVSKTMPFIVSGFGTYLFSFAAIAGMRDLFPLERSAPMIVANELERLHQAFLWGRCVHIAVPVRFTLIEVVSGSSTRPSWPRQSDGMASPTCFVVRWNRVGRKLSGLGADLPILLKVRALLSTNGIER